MIERTRTMLTLLHTLTALLLAIVAAVPPDDPEPVVTVTVLWLMPAPEGGWPQTLTSGGVCGGWAAETLYEAPESVVAAIVEDARRDEGEDAAALVSERVVALPPCAPPAPAQPAEPEPGVPSFTG